ISEMVFSQMLAAMLADGILYIIICFLCKSAQSILPGLAAIAGQAVLASLWSVLAHNWYFWKFPPKNAYIVYDEREGFESLLHQYSLVRKFKITKTFTAEEVVNDVTLLDGAEDVFLSGVHSHDRNIIIKYCTAQNINALLIPRIGDVIMSGAHQMHIMHLPVLMVSRYRPTPEFRIVKRAFDILMSLFLLILFSPVLIVTAIAVKADGGPVFYKQKRLTRNRAVFEVIKFRSMRVDAEKDGVARLSTGENDDRITKVGRIIRKFRIDELPQLFNVLKGDMSLVGPRPERPEIAEQYEKEIPEFALRLQCKAGLTGYAQVYGKYNTTPYDKLMMDLMYIADPSLVADLRIILATIKILFVPESTEGVVDGQVTAMDQKTDKEE
ncbi:MAG: exopolysaccharide biosynthesis polyprenyl glycosylphosphotransferase, partial [Lachnospiraceae bacterium]|nr:exopolysaccharide biosynthesis polyprenyl glycosylphosphotransferase [Lachnospiraceae bacterium]